MAKKYLVLFKGFIGNRENFKESMLHLGASPQMVDTMISKAPVILKKDLALKDQFYPPAAAIFGNLDRTFSGRH